MPPAIGQLPKHSLRAVRALRVAIAAIKSQNHRQLQVQSEIARISTGMSRSAMGVVGVIVLVAIRVYFRYERNQARQARQDNQMAVAAPLPSFGGCGSSRRCNDRTLRPGQCRLLPPPAHGTMIEPGVVFSEIKLGLLRQPARRRRPAMAASLALFAWRPARCSVAPVHFHRRSWLKPDHGDGSRRWRPSRNICHMYARALLSSGL